MLGRPIELVFADHQNKPDVAANLARGWFEQGKVDMATDFPTTSTALAVMEIAKQKNRVVMPSVEDTCSILSMAHLWGALPHVDADAVARAPIAGH